MKTMKQVEKERAKYAKHQVELSRLSELLAGIPDKPISAKEADATHTPHNSPRMKQQRHSN